MSKLPKKLRERAAILATPVSLQQILLDAARRIEELEKEISKLNKNTKL